MKIELIKKASNYCLIYIFFNYWITPLYFFLDKLYNDSRYGDSINIYGDINYIPFYILAVTLFVLIVNSSSNLLSFKKYKLESNKYYFFKLKIDNIISISLFLASIILFFLSSSSYRYSGSNEGGLFSGLNFLRSFFPYLFLPLWFIRGNYTLKSNEKKRWYFNTILYSLCTLILNSGLGSILEFFAWIHQIVTSKDEKGNNIINDFMEYLKANSLFKSKIKLINLLLLIFLFFTPIILNRIILIGHNSKNIDIQNLKKGGINLDLPYYVNTYFIKLGFSRPEFYTVYKAPQISDIQRQMNRNDFLNNFSYRLKKLLGKSSNMKGIPPNRTNLIHIASYDYRLNEGTSPGILSSFNYYFGPSTSIPLEMIFLFLSCFFIAALDKQKSEGNLIRRFLVVFFILREFLCSPLSILMIFDHSIISPFILVMYYLIEDLFTEKLRVQN